MTTPIRVVLDTTTVYLESKASESVQQQRPRKGDVRIDPTREEAAA